MSTQDLRTLVQKRDESLIKFIDRHIKRESKRTSLLARLEIRTSIQLAKLDEWERREKQARSVNSIHNTIPL